MPVPPQNVSLTPTQERLVQDVERMLGALTGIDGPTPSISGHMRVRAGDRERDLLLGSRTVTGRTTVLDWRAAPLAEVFFRYRPGDDYEVDVDDRVVTGTLVSRHRLGFAGGQLVEIQGDDEVLARAGDGTWIATTPLAPPPPGLHARRRPALPVLDAAQRRAVELADDLSVLVDGEAGVGKTLVALHRLAHLRERAAQEGRRFRAAVLAPTEGLRRLCRQIADRLGIERVEIATVDDWLTERGRKAFPALPERTSLGATAGVVRLKRHPGVRAALDDLAPRAAYDEDDRPLSAVRADLLYLFGDRERLDRVVAAAGGALPERAVDEVMAHTHVQFTRTTEQAHRHVDADRLIAVDDRPLDAGTPLEDAGSFDVEDVPVLFELARRRGKGIAAALPTYDHIVLDEAQLVAPLELAVIGSALRRGGTLTVAGDPRQETDDSAWFGGWDAALRELGVEQHQHVTLTQTYRSAAPITAVARALTAQPPASVPAASPAVRATAFPGEFHLVAEVAATLEAMVAGHPHATVAVVARTRTQARRLHDELARGLDTTLVLDGAFTFEPGIVVTTGAEIQGLEFDAVVIPDVAPEPYPATPEAQRALYVALTRARDWLWLATSDRWSPLIHPEPAAAEPA